MRVLKRHLRAESTGPNVEPGWAACGVGPRYTVTRDRALVTCERAACGGKASVRDEERRQIEMAFETNGGAS